MSATAPVASVRARPPRKNAPRRRATDTPRPTRPEDAIQLLPLPEGQPLARSIRSDYVALDRVLESLSRDGHTGYLRLHGEDLNGAVLMEGGAVVQTLFDAAPVVITGSRAMALVREAVEAGRGMIDVAGLSTELVAGVYQMLTAPTLYSRLYTRFIDMAQLVAQLSDDEMSGCILVSNREERGVVLLREGRVLAAYTSFDRDPRPSAEMLLRLCNDPNTEIEVRGAWEPVEPPSHSVHEALSAADAAQEIPARAAATAAGSIPPRVGDAEIASAWEATMERMTAAARRSLGHNAQAVVDVLQGCRPGDILDGISEVARLQVMFVPQQKLEALASELAEIAASA